MTVIIILICGRENYLVKKWYINTFSFICGYSLVIRGIYDSSTTFDTNEKEYNYVDLEGNYLSENWFKKAYEFDKTDKIARVIINYTDYFIDTSGNIRYCTNEELDKYVEKH